MQGVDSRKALVVPGKVEAQKAALEGEGKEEEGIQYSSFQTSFSKEHGMKTNRSDDDM
jgi:hypothetical protein